MDDTQSWSSGTTTPPLVIDESSQLSLTCAPSQADSEEVAISSSLAVANQHDLPQPETERVVEATSSSSRDVDKPDRHQQKLSDFMVSASFQMLETAKYRIFYSRQHRRNKLNPGLYVHRIPGEVGEAELLPLFHEIDPCFEVKFELEPGTRVPIGGHCYLDYLEASATGKALKKLNNYEIRPGVYLSAHHYDTKYKLYLTNLPRDKSTYSVKDEIFRSFEGVSSVQISSDWKTCRVEFANWPMTEAARKRIQQFAGVKLFGGYRVGIDWLAMNDLNRNKVYVGRFDESVTPKQVEQAFERYGEVAVVQKHSTFAFVIFVNAESVQKAVNDSGNVILGTDRVSVSMPSNMLDKPRHHSDSHNQASSSRRPLASVNNNRGRQQTMSSSSAATDNRQHHHHHRERSPLQRRNDATSRADRDAPKPSTSTNAGHHRQSSSTRGGENSKPPSQLMGRLGPAHQRSQPKSGHLPVSAGQSLKRPRNSEDSNSNNTSERRGDSDSKKSRLDFGTRREAWSNGRNFR